VTAPANRGSGKLQADIAAGLQPDITGKFVETTREPCPYCAEEGHTTFGGYTPFLRFLPDEGPSRLFCLLHGYMVTTAE
jgi:hypothetical protein